MIGRYFNDVVVKELNKLYKDNNTVNNITREQMRRLLHYCVKLNHFMFDNQYYDQIDGVAMESSLGPILADIFMSDFENKVFDTFDGNSPLLKNGMLATFS